MVTFELPTCFPENVMIAYVTTLALAFALSQDGGQEKPRVPEDSIELTVIGCLKGRVLTTTGKRQADVESGPYVGERTFRLAGKRDLMKDVEQHNRHLVEVVGIVKRSSLDDKGVKAGRVTISGGSPAAGRGIPSPDENVAVMDISAVRMRSSSCSGE
jgi:hypothetical protein